MQTVNTAQQNLVLTAGVDGRIRFWDVKKESESFVVAGSGGERIGPANVKYTRKIVDGVDVIQEVSASPKQDSSSSSPGPSSPKAKGGGLLPSLHSPPQLQQQQKQQQQSPQPSLPSYMGMDQLVNKPGLEPPALGTFSLFQSNENIYLLTSFLSFQDITTGFRACLSAKAQIRRTGTSCLVPGTE